MPMILFKIIWMEFSRVLEVVPGHPAAALTSSDTSGMLQISVAAETEDVGAKARIPKMAINAAVTIFIKLMIFIKLIFMILLRY